MSHPSDLEAVCDQILIECLPASLKETVDAALASGASPGAIVKLAAIAAGDRGQLTMLGLQAYLESRKPKGNPMLKPDAQDGCHAGKDGDCNWQFCPQEKDGEPAKSGRHCPLDRWRDEDEC
jgi:hypothetical protein